MATKTDKAAVNAAKNSTKTNQSNQKNAQTGIDGGSAVKAGANRIVDFIDQASDVASNTKSG